MKCTKCGAKNKSSDIYCSECGKKLTKAKSKKVAKAEAEPSSKVAPWLVPWLVIAGLLVIGGAILLPTKVASYETGVPYIATEEYTVEVPYEDVEPYTERIQYEEEEQYVASVPVPEQEDYWDEECRSEYLKYGVEWVTCSVTFFSSGESTLKLTNVDSEGGIFAIDIGYITDLGDLVTITQSKYVGPAGSTTFTYTPTPSSFQTCRYQPQSIPTKQVCELVSKTRTVTNYKDVIKTKTVTKYRDETRYKKVAKIRTETREREVQKTRIERQYKEVNWLFDFDAIIKFRRNLPQPEVISEG